MCFCGRGSSRFLSHDLSVVLWQSGPLSHLGFGYFSKYVSLRGED